MAGADIIMLLGDLFNFDEVDFPDDFKEYMKKELSSYQLGNGRILDGWVFWSREDDEPTASLPQNFPYDNSDIIPHTPPPPPPTAIQQEKQLKVKINNLLNQLLQIRGSLIINGSLLIQFWAPVIVEGRLLLTTNNQPFALKINRRKELCGYRMICKDEYKFYVDGEVDQQDLGLLGRVFRNKLPEFTPNVEYYSRREYPQLDHAIRCHVRQSLALPVFESSGQICVGVLELVTTEKFVLMKFILDDISSEFSSPAVGLKCPDVHDHHSKQDDNKRRVITIDDLHQIRTAFKQQVGKADEVISLAQVWVPCNLCIGNALSTVWSIFNCEDRYKNFRFTCELCHLQKGQGIVGSVLLSNSVLFCTDVTQFSIAEYPMAHYARDYGLSGCLAICLHTGYTEKDVYVLEFFLPTRSYETAENLLSSLRKLLGIIKKNFPYSKLASGEGMAEELPIEVIEFYDGWKHCYTHVPRTKRNSGLGASSNCGIKKDYHSLSLSIQGAHDDQVQTSHLSSQVSTTVANPRWPLRERKNDIQALLVESLQGGHIARGKRVIISHTSSQVSNSSQGSNSWQSSNTDTTMEDMNTVTIKALYGNDTRIKFKLSLSSGLVELQQQVEKRLNIEGGTYYIKYEDEDGELILIACDEDLREYIETSIRLHRTWVEILLEPK